MSFLPLPEVTSGWMYDGVGSGSLHNAAPAWQGVADSLEAAVAKLRGVAGGLRASGRGSVVAAMADTVLEDAETLSSLGVSAREVGRRARVVAEAFEDTRAAMVPLATVEANRVQARRLAAAHMLHMSGRDAAVSAKLDRLYEDMRVRNLTALGEYHKVVWRVVGGQDPVVWPTPNPLLSPPPRGTVAPRSLWPARRIG